MKLEFSRGGKTILTPLPLLPNFRRKEPTMSENQMKLIKDIGLKEYGTQGCKIRYGLFECPICKKHFETRLQDVKNGKTTKCKSCASTIKNTTHGLRNHRLYNIWNGIRGRILNPKNKDYKYYGLKGITICDRWLDIENFIEDMYPTYEEGLTIDRIDNNLGYCKENCRWATMATQQRNKIILMSTNKSGYKGVHFHKRDNKWHSIIVINRKTINLGYFKTALEAAKAYNNYVIDNKLEHTINDI